MLEATKQTDREILREMINMTTTQIRFNKKDECVVYIQTHLGKVVIRQTPESNWEDSSLTVIIQHKEDMTISLIDWDCTEVMDKGLIIVPTKNLEEGR